MRNILCAAMAFLFLTSVAHGADLESEWMLDPVPKRFYVFFMSDSISYKYDTTVYDGMEFPLYVGYVVVKDHTFTFVKKTPLPLEDLVAFFDATKAVHRVDPIQDINRRRGPHVPPDDDFLTACLHWDIERCFRDVLLVGFTGEPDENYTPVFEKTCVYRANPEKPCTSSEFDTAPGYLIIPTSNVMKERIGYRRGPEGERRVERYNPETKTWEDIGKY